MKSGVLGATIGAVVGALISSAVIIGLVLFGRLGALPTVDELSFALVVVGVVITALTVLGSFTLINTWNDIDKRTMAIVDKYEQEAKKEIDRNAAERQQAINSLGDHAIAEANRLTQRLQHLNKLLTVRTLALFGVYFALSLWIQNRARRQD